MNDLMKNCSRFELELVAKLAAKSGEEARETTGATEAVNIVFMHLYELATANMNIRDEKKLRSLGLMK